MSFRSVAQGGDTNVGPGTQTITVDKPAGTTDGDILFASISWFIEQHGAGDPQTGALNAPAGWTLVASDLFTVSSPLGNNGIAVWRKTAASEPSTWDFTSDSVTVPEYAWTVSAYTADTFGGYFTVVRDNFALGDGSNTITFDALTTVTDSTVLYFVYAWGNNPNAGHDVDVALTWPSGVTERATEDFDQGAQNPAILNGVGEEAGGATPSRVFTMDVTDQGGAVGGRWRVIRLADPSWWDTPAEPEPEHGGAASTRPTRLGTFTPKVLPYHIDVMALSREARDG